MAMVENDCRKLPKVREAAAKRQTGNTFILFPRIFSTYIKYYRHELHVVKFGYINPIHIMGIFFMIQSCARKWLLNAAAIDCLESVLIITKVHRMVMVIIFYFQMLVEEYVVIQLISHSVYRPMKLALVITSLILCVRFIMFIGRP